MKNINGRVEDNMKRKALEKPYDWYSFLFSEQLIYGYCEMDESLAFKYFMFTIFDSISNFDCLISYNPLKLVEFRSVAGAPITKKTFDIWKQNNVDR